MEINGFKFKKKYEVEKGINLRTLATTEGYNIYTSPHSAYLYIFDEQKNIYQEVDIKAKQNDMDTWKSLIKTYSRLNQR